MLTGFKKDFVYEERYLKGAEFNVYAAESIFTPDYQKDENGNRQLILSLIHISSGIWLASTVTAMVVSPCFQPSGFSIVIAGVVFLSLIHI